MNNNNFTAQEIKSLQSTALGVFKEIIDSIKAVKQACSNISGVVASGDSSLSGRWSTIADSITGPVTTAAGSFNFIGDILNNYVEQTVSNEQTAESDLGSIDAEIGALGAAAGALVDLGSLGNGTVAAPVSGAAATAGRVATAGGVAATVGGAGFVAPSIPTAIYAPPSATFVEAHPIDTGTRPSVIYAPPTPSASIKTNE